MPFCQLHLIQAGTQDLQRLILVLQLGLLILAGDHDSRGNMGQTHCGIRGIDTLPAISGSTEYVEFALIQIQMEVDLLRLRHDRHCDGGGVDPSAGLRLRHTLHPVHAAFVFQPGISSLPVDHEGGLLEAPDSILVQAHHLCFPMTALRIFYQHPVDFRCKEGCLIPAGSGADLHDHVFVIVGILRKEQDLQLMLQLPDPFFGV